MNKLFAILLLGIFIGNAYTQTGDSPDQETLNLTPAEEAAIIKDIREKFTLISSDLNTYEKRSGELEDYSTEGGEYTVYYDEEDPLKIKALYYGEMGRVAIDYYLWDMKVFFVFQQRFTYNSPIYLSEDIPDQGIEAFDESRTIITENRYYFYNGQMIRWIDDERNMVDTKSDEFKEAEIWSREDIEFILDIAL